MISDGVRRRQRLLHEVNDGIAGVAAGWSETGSYFLCECGRGDCWSLVSLDLAEIAAVHATPDRFFTATGHVLVEVDLLEESRDGYDIVRMIP